MKAKAPSLGMLLVLGFLLLVSRPAAGQAVSIDQWTPSLPTSGERKAADVASWVTALADVALDTKVSWDAPDRRRAFVLQGVRIGVTYGAVFAVKSLVHRTRPCAPDCGADNPQWSFYSAHTALAFQSLSGPRLALTLPLAVGTGGLRVAGGKHWLTDVLVGAAVGTVTSRIRP